MKNNTKIIEQSGVIPFFLEDGKIKIVLVTSRGSGEWIIPKGMLEENMTIEQSAANEALEEAGVEGKIGNNVFSEYNYQKWQSKFLVKIYLLKVETIHQVWDEIKFRNIKIVDLFEALKIIKPDQLQVLKDFANYISQKNSVN